MTGLLISGIEVAKSKVYAFQNFVGINWIERIEKISPLLP